MDVIYKACSEAMGITQGHVAQEGDTRFFSFPFFQPPRLEIKYKRHQQALLCLLLH